MQNRKNVGQCLTRLYSNILTYNLPKVLQNGGKYFEFAKRDSFALFDIWLPEKVSGRNDFFLPQNDWPVKDLSEYIYFSHIQFHYPLYFIKFHFYDFDPVKSISPFNGLDKFHQRTPAIRPPLTGKCFLCAEGLKKHPYLVLKGWNF